MSVFELTFYIQIAVLSLSGAKPDKLLNEPVGKQLQGQWHNVFLKGTKKQNNGESIN